MGKFWELSKSTLTEEQATSLFNKYCMYISNGNAITLIDAKIILDNEAVEYAIRCRKSGATYNCFGIGHYQCEYLSKKGFLDAVTFYNVEQVYVSEVKLEDDKTTGKQNGTKRNSDKGKAVQ